MDAREPNAAPLARSRADPFCPLATCSPLPSPPCLPVRAHPPQLVPPATRPNDPSVTWQSTVFPPEFRVRVHMCLHACTDACAHARLHALLVADGCKLREQLHTRACARVYACVHHLSRTAASLASSCAFHADPTASRAKPAYVSTTVKTQPTADRQLNVSALAVHRCANSPCSRHV